MADQDSVAISVVSPVFNSERTLAELASRVGSACEPLASRWELILVNDGSADGSWEAISALCARHRELRGVDLVRNFGQHPALRAGIDSARFELIVTLDDDLQNPPEEIPALIEALRPGVDLVYGTPRRRRQTAARRLGAGAMRWLAHAASRGRVPRQYSSFRAFRARLWRETERGRGALGSIDAQLGLGARSPGSVRVRHDPRRDGRSNYTHRMLARHAAATLKAAVAPPPVGSGDPGYSVRLRIGPGETRDEPAV